MHSAPAASQTTSAYDRFAYPGFTYRVTHPAHLEVIARLFSLQPAPASSCRVLELGCGDGANLLSMAQTLPGSGFLGIDAAETAIARGSALAEAAGLTNVELRLGNLESLPENLGDFDYIVAHGVYSWIPSAARGALLACCHSHLAPHGVAYVSYNAYPGSYLRDMTRDILRYHVRDEQDPQARLAGAQQLMATIVSIEEPSPFARVLREHMERMLQASDALLFHDDLAEISTAFYFHEFMEHATAHGLAFLSEADMSESQMRDVPASVGELMASLPNDVIVREQYLDFFKNRMFRQTLLCHPEAPVKREIYDTHVEQLAISSPAQPQDPGPHAPARQEAFVTPDGAVLTTRDPLVRGAMHALAQAWPAALDFPGLLSRAQAGASSLAPDRDESADAAQLREVLLQAYLARVVLLQSVVPAVAVTAPERPMTTPLARAQVRSGERIVSTLLHWSIALDDEVDRQLLPLLDGTRDRAALRDAMPDGADVEAGLQRLARQGLLLHPAS